MGIIVVTPSISAFVQQLARFHKIPPQTLIEAHGGLVPLLEDYGYDDD
jgi:hypothetical protein